MEGGGGISDVANSLSISGRTLAFISLVHRPSLTLAFDRCKQSETGVGKALV